MIMIDKHKYLEKINGLDNVAIELGCGTRKKTATAIGIDIRNLPDVDIVGDGLTILNKIPSEVIDNVYAHHFFEHIDNVDEYMVALNRTMKVKAKLEIITPHFSNPYYYSDPTHKTPFGLYSLAYFCRNSLFTREVPRYEKGLSFKLLDVNLIFKSPRPFYIRWGIKKIWQKIFNSNRFMKELYEENFCYFIPCYEIQYLVEKV